MLHDVNTDRCTQRSKDSNVIDLLHLYAIGGEGFLLLTDTGDEIWVDQFEPESNWKLIEWHHVTFQREKKFKSVPSAGKIMATVFWDEKDFTF
jgi:hypothetical protein